MTNQVRHINDSILSDDEVQRLSHALAPVVKGMVNDEVFTVVEAAEFLKYKPNRIYMFMKKGFLRAHRIDGGDPRFIKSELLEDLKKL